MVQTISIHLETWEDGPSQGFHPVKGAYEHRKAATLTDAPAKLTSRQAVFYRNLIRLAELTLSQDIPIHFVEAAGNHVAMDLGCVNMAEHAGFIEALRDGPSGYLESIHLAWSVLPDGA
jgi:hypothetical protein